MVKSLFAGAAALGLIATAAFGQEAYDSAYGRSTTPQAYPVAPSSPVTSTSSTTVQTSADPYAGTTVERRETATGAPIAPGPLAAGRVSTYREQSSIGPDGQAVEKSVTSEAQTPCPRASYSETTTRATD